MTVYATRADAETYYGTTTVALVCSRDGVADYASFDAHLQVASDEIESYLMGRYALPLATVPAVFTSLCCDIAIYRSSLNADTRTDEMRKRYEDALTYLRDVALNKVKLVQNEVNQSQAASTVAGRTIATTYGARVFTTENTRSVL